MNNDQLKPVTRKSDTSLSGHTMADVFKKDGWNAPAWPLLLFSIIVIIQYFFGGMICKVLYRFFPSL